MGKKTLVLGVSLKEARYSNKVIHKLIADNHEVRAIGFKEGSVANINVIFNPGTENEEFQKILEKNGIKNETACTLVLLSTKQY
jgi:predicted CoA-binding protein